MVEKLSRPLWLPIQHVLCGILQRRAQSASRALIAADSASPPEAREKTLYLMAIVIAASDELNGQDVERAHSTLMRNKEVLTPLFDSEPG